MNLSPVGLDEWTFPPNVEERAICCVTSPACWGKVEVKFVDFVRGPVPFSENFISVFLC